MTRSRGIRLLMILCLILPVQTFALDVIFGPEFTFAPPQGGQAFRGAVLRQMWNHLVKGQKAGAKFSKKDIDDDFTKFQSPNGWSFTVSLDPGVVEVQMEPMTVEMFDHFKSDIQDAIFASASNVGYFPARFTGGGHINISCDEFRKNPLLFRNFIVDMFNHNELFMGVFGYDTHNAISWYLKNQRHKLEKVIQDFDNGRYTDGFETFAVDLEKVLNTSADRFVKIWDDRPLEKQLRSLKMRTAKAHMINFEHIKTQNRLEIRAIRPQTNINTWVRQIRLIRNRLKYLERFKTGIPLDIQTPVEAIDLENKEHQFYPPVRAQDALRAFYIYVTESGEKWLDHRDYLWPDWIKDGELKKFEESDWFRKQEQRLETDRSCEAQLGA